jgi:hypothetical protein
MREPALASVADLQARMGPLDDVARAQALLDDASALMRSEVDPVTWLDDEGDLDPDRPAVLVGICCNVVQRSLTNPAGVSAESLADFQASYANASPDLYLTRSERRTIRKAAGLSGVLGSVQLESPHPLIEKSGTFVDVVGGDHIDWL